MMRIFKARRGLMGCFLACLLVMLSHHGASHGHGTAPGHHECDICQVSSQPYMAAEPAVYPEPAAPYVLAPDAATADFSVRRHEPFSPRAPPAG